MKDENGEGLDEFALELSLQGTVDRLVRETITKHNISGAELKNVFNVLTEWYDKGHSTFELCKRLDIFPKEIAQEGVRFKRPLKLKETETESESEEDEQAKRG